MARGSLVDDHDAIAPGAVGPTEIATLAQMHTHGAEVAWRYDADQGVEPRPVRIRLPLWRESPTPIATQRKHVRNAGRFDPGDRIDVAEDLLQDGAAPRPVASIVVIYLDHGGPARLESQVHIQDS